jgi:hypothetical protein
MMPAAVQCDTPPVPLSIKTECKEEVLVNMIRKIGFIAACIDLHDWRTIIDEVLREVEAEYEIQQLEPEPSRVRTVQPPASRLDSLAAGPRAAP